MKRFLGFLLLSFLLLLSACSQPDSAGLTLEPERLSAGSADFVAGEVIVKFRSGLNAQNLSVSGQALQRVRTLGAADSGVQLYRAALTDKGATQRLIEALAARPDVLYAHPNYRLSATRTPNDAIYSYQWHYPAINLPAAWDKTTGSSSIRVAVIDSGVLLNHPDLKSKVVPGYDFVSNPSISADGNGRDNNPDDPGGDYHGSHVAGTIAAATNNGIGVAGVSWGSRILPVRVLGPAGGDLADIIDGILWSVGRSVSGVPANANPAQILNLSLGGAFPCSEVPALQSALNTATAAGATVVVAAGNENDDARGYSPAGCTGVITVGATNFLNTRAYYSNYGPRIDVMAPGGDMTADENGDTYLDGVLSTLRDANNQDSYNFYQGTSMAAPHVAGVIALMKSANASLTRTQILDILKRTARPISHSSCSVGCGAGLIDAAAAVQGNPTTPPATYAINFTSTSVPVGRVISSVSLGRGITSSTGKITSNVGLFAQRKDKSGNMAMMAGTARHLIISKDGSSQTSYATGGLIDVKFAGFGTGKVDLKTLKVRNTTTTGGSVSVYRGSVLAKRVSLPKTGAGFSQILTLDVTSATSYRVTLTGPGAMDDVVFVAPR